MYQSQLLCSCAISMNDSEPEWITTPITASVNATS